MNCVQLRVWKVFLSIITRSNHIYWQIIHAQYVSIRNAPDLWGLDFWNWILKIPDCGKHVFVCSRKTSTWFAKCLIISYQYKSLNWIRNLTKKIWFISFEYDPKNIRSSIYLDLYHYHQLDFDLILLHGWKFPTILTTKVSLMVKFKVV